MSHQRSMSIQVLQRRNVLLLSITVSIVANMVCSFQHSHSHHVRRWAMSPPTFRQMGILFSDQQDSSAVTNNNSNNDNNNNNNSFGTLRSALEKLQALQSASSAVEVGSSSPPYQASFTAWNEFQRDLSKRVTVKTSTIPGAGMGLFAAQGMDIGTIVGLYPTHCIGIAMEESSPYVTLDVVNQNYFDSDHQGDSNTMSRSNYMQFIVGSRPLLGVNVAQAFEGYPIFIDTNPNQPVQPGWVAHLVNDGAIVTENSEAGLLEYYTQSNLRNNCVNIPFGPSPIVATVTTKALQRGEELFTSYGCLYWLQDILEPDEEPTDITDAVLEQSKETAKLLLSSMQKAGRTYVDQVTDLKELFENI